MLAIQYLKTRLSTSLLFLIPGGAVHETRMSGLGTSPLYTQPIQTQPCRFHCLGSLLESSKKTAFQISELGSFSDSFGRQQLAREALGQVYLLPRPMWTLIAGMRRSSPTLALQKSLAGSKHGCKPLHKNWTDQKEG